MGTGPTSSCVATSSLRNSPLSSTRATRFSHWHQAPEPSMISLRALRTLLLRSSGPHRTVSAGSTNSSTRAKNVERCERNPRLHEIPANSLSGTNSSRRDTSSISWSRTALAADFWPPTPHLHCLMTSLSSSTPQPPRANRSPSTRCRSSIQRAAQATFSSPPTTFSNARGTMLTSMRQRRRRSSLLLYGGSISIRVARRLQLLP